MPSKLDKFTNKCLTILETNTLEKAVQKIDNLDYLGKRVNLKEAFKIYKCWYDNVVEGSEYGTTTTTTTTTTTNPTNLQRAAAFYRANK